jgi:hypothetical protein
MPHAEETMTFDADDLRFLESMARDVIEASRVRPGERIGTSPANSLGHTLIRPGGRACYPAMWVRDFSMSLDCGLIPRDEVQQHLDLILRSRNGSTERRLRNGTAVIPPLAVPDHINFDGGSVFYPGTYSAGDDQGGEPFGVLPPIDDQFELIHIAHHLKLPTDDERLTQALDAVPVDPALGGMVATSADRRAVGFGFCDAVYLTGALLFPSLLRYRAAIELQRAQLASEIASHLVPVFADKENRHGWLCAATDVGHQPDVWGTLYALHLNVLPETFAKLARQTVADAVTRGTITHQGAVRHIPTDFGSWEKVAPGVAVNTYQNGAYWHTPTGWLISALARSHPELAKKIFAEYITHLREQDFRRGEAFGAPWECFGLNGAHQQNAVYMASVTVPLGVIQQLNAS